jgi:hypothetical protein
VWCLPILKFTIVASIRGRKWDVFKKVSLTRQRFFLEIMLFFRMKTMPQRKREALLSEYQKPLDMHPNNVFKQNSS